MRSIKPSIDLMSAKDLMKFVVMTVFFIWCANGQYPASTIEWDYMPITGSDNVDIIKGVVLNKGGTNAKLNNKSTWRNPSITQLGWMFEGYEIAWGGPNANLNMGDTFGTHIWIYFTDITTDQTIWWKEWLQTETNKTLNSLRLWLYLRSGHFAVLWNPQIATKHLKNENLTDSFNYDTVKLDIVAKFGWIYLAVNFKTNPETQKASIWAYYTNHDQWELVSSTYTLPGPIVDDNNYILCIGGTANPNRVTLKYELYQPLMALVNGWVFVKGALIERYNAFDYYGFQWHDYWQICRNKDQPKWLEDYETHVLHYWDFAPFRWYRPVYDYGSK